MVRFTPLSPAAAFLYQDPAWSDAGREEDGQQADDSMRVLAFHHSTLGTRDLARHHSALGT